MFSCLEKHSINYAKYSTFRCYLQKYRTKTTDMISVSEKPDTSLSH